MVGAVALLYIGSQPTTRWLSPLGALALLVGALPVVLPEGSFRRAAIAFSPLAVMYAVADAFWHPGMNFVLEGVITGLLTSLLAIGIVIVYRANRIVNFAQAEMGALPGNLALLLVAAQGWNYFVAAGAGLAAAILLGVLVEFLFLRRFFKSPRLIATVATIGIAQVLLGVSLFLPQWIGKTNTLTFPEELPLSFHVGTTSFSGNEVLVLFVVPVVLVALSAFFRFSAVGTALRASAESADRASMLGIPVRRLQSVLWAIVGVLAYVTIFLRIGVVGTTLTQAMDPTVLLAALGAAVIGRFERLPTTLFAAVGLGIVSEAIFNAWNADAARPVVITIIIAVALLVQSGGNQMSRLRNAAISTWQTTREVRPIPAELRREPAVVGTQIALAALLAIGAVCIPIFLPENRVSQIGTMGIYAMVGIALVMLTGWAGQVSLGQMGIVGVAGATGGWFAVNFSDPVIGGTIVVMLIGGIAGALVTVIIGMPTLRARGLTFAVMSLAFALMTSDYLLNQGYSPLRSWLPTADAWYQNGSQLPRPPLLTIAHHDFLSLSSETSLYWAILAMLVAVVFAARGLRNSRSGRVLIGVRENERAAAAYSISAPRAMLLAFTLSGFVTGIAGALFHLQQQSISVNLFNVDASLQLFAMVVVGGLGSIGGAVLGAVYVFGAQYFLPPGGWSFLATGAGVLLVLLLRWYARRRNIRVPSLVADTRVVEMEVPEPVIVAGEATPGAEIMAELQHE
jgi:branched-chain amino acid transport system permease protein